MHQLYGFILAPVKLGCGGTLGAPFDTALAGPLLAWLGYRLHAGDEQLAYEVFVA